MPVRCTDILKRIDAGGLIGRVSGHEEPWDIGALAQALGVSLRALRFYEEQHLLSPQREGMMRLFSAADAERAAAISILRSVGLSVQQIRAWLTVVDAHEEGYIAADNLIDLLATQARDVQDRLLELNEIAKLLSKV